MRSLYLEANLKAFFSYVGHMQRRTASQPDTTQVAREALFCLILPLDPSPTCTVSHECGPFTHCKFLASGSEDTFG